MKIKLWWHSKTMFKITFFPLPPLWQQVFLFIKYLFMVKDYVYLKLVHDLFSWRVKFLTFLLNTIWALMYFWMWRYWHICKYLWIFNAFYLIFQIQLVVSSITIFIINICVWWSSAVYSPSKSRWMDWKRDLLLICFNCVKDIHAGFLFNFLLYGERRAEQSVTQIQSSLKPAF